MAIKKRRTKSKPKPTTISTTSNSPPVGPVLEFRHSGSDDAWYSVNLVLLNDTLLVKFREFGDDDVAFLAGNLKSSGDVSDLRRRFRPLSKQLEASDCRWGGRAVVREGTRVCALRVFAEDDHRFYDAVIEAVKHEEHTIVNGSEKCSCSFVLTWLHGPEEGTMTSAGIEDLCPIRSGAQIDPRLACFLKIAEWKNGLTSPCYGLFTEDVTCAQVNPIFSEHKPPSVVEKSDYAMQTGSMLLDDEEFIGLQRNEDVDMGGGGGVRTLTNVGQEAVHHLTSGGREYPCTNMTEQKASSQRDGENGHYSPSSTKKRMVEDVPSSDSGRIRKFHTKTNAASTDTQYFILVENLERDVSPSTIVDFIRAATCLDIEAFILSSLATELYARGALVVNSAEELDQLCKFVTKPDQMITSSKGRPWIVTDASSPELVRTSFWCLEPDLKDEKQSSAREELKVVELGSEEYRKAVQLRDLFMEFTKHQEQLLKRLASEEQSIMNS